MGSLIPSSRFLEKRIVKTAALDRAELVVELGPGTGGTTRAVLRRLQPDARMLAIEISPEFVALLRRSIKDSRLLVHEGSAGELAAVLARHGLGPPTVVLSGIPFSTMPRKQGASIVEEIYRMLAPGGRFVAYQFRDRVELLGREVFGPARVEVEVLNVPPMRIYCWEKKATEEGVDLALADEGAV